MLLIFSYFILLAIRNNPKTKPSHCIPFSHSSYDESLFNINETEEGIGRYIYSNTVSSTRMQFPYTRFWVEGYKRSYPLKVIIYYGTNFDYANVDLSGEPQDAIIYFESPQSDFSYSSVVLGDRLTSTTDSPIVDITFSRILYNYLSPLDTIPSNGLIRIYYNDITYDSNWAIDGVTMSTSIPQASASCFFYGIKVFIYANTLTNGGNMEVYIDDELQDTINLQSESPAASIVYSSHDLPFGKHKIEVKHSDSSDKSINLICFLYRPHLIVDALVYNPTFPTGWTSVPDSGTNPSYYETSTTATTQVIRCTRFWLVGLKGMDYGSFNIRVSLGSEIKVNTNVSTQVSSSSTLYSVLLYESPVFEYGSNSITITPLDGRPIAISNFIFSQQPKDAVIVYGKDLKVSGTHAFNSGRETVGLKDQGATFEFNYFGSHFSVFGETDHGGAGYNIHDNGFLVKTGTALGDEIRLNLLEDLERSFGNHPIKFTQTSDSSKYLYINYIFYLTYSNSPVEPYKILSINDIDSTYDVGETTDEYIELPLIGSKATFIYGGYNFTLQGYVGPAHGNVNIYDNDLLLHSDVPLYREESKLSFFYASGELEGGIHHISVVNCNGNFVGISKLYYKPTPTAVFTRSTSFSDSEFFSNSIQFSKSEYFTLSFTFSNSETFTQSTAFTHSESFTKSSRFSESEGFSQSNELISSNFSSSISFSSSSSFTSSISFTLSDSFSASNSHVSSNSFTASFELNQKSGIDNKSSNMVNIIIGVVVGIIAVAIIVLVIVFVYFRRQKKNPSQDDHSMHEAEATSMNIAEMTRNDEIDSVMNSFSNDLFGDRNYEEDQNEYGHKF